MRSEYCSDAVRLDAIDPSDIDQALVDAGLPGAREPFQRGFLREGFSREWRRWEGFERRFRYMSEAGDVNLAIVSELVQDFAVKVERQLGVEGFFNYAWVRFGDRPRFLQGDAWHMDLFGVQAIAIHDIPGLRRYTEIEVVKTLGPEVGVDFNGFKLSLLKNGFDKVDTATEAITPILGVQDALENQGELQRRYVMMHRRHYPYELPPGATVNRALFGLGWKPEMAGVEAYREIVKKMVARGLFGNEGQFLDDCTALSLNYINSVGEMPELHGSFKSWR